MAERRTSVLLASTASAWVIWAVDAVTPGHIGHGIVPRTLYGDYLQTLLSEAEAAAAGDVALKRLRAEVVDVVPVARGFEVKLKVSTPLLAGGARRA